MLGKFTWETVSPPLELVEKYVFLKVVFKWDFAFLAVSPFEAEAHISKVGQVRVRLCMFDVIRLDKQSLSASEQFEFEITNSMQFNAIKRLLEYTEGRNSKGIQMRARVCICVCLRMRVYGNA